MKKLCVLMTGIVVLFLVSCQQKEDIELQQENVEYNFKKLGDKRNPAEFMSPEDIALVQDVFKATEGKTLKNPVTKLPQTRMGTAIEWDRGVWLLQESEIPTVKVAGQYLYTKVMMFYYEETETFDARVSYRLGATGSTFNLGWKQDNCKEAFVSENQVQLWIRGCYFTIPLENNPQYNEALVNFSTIIQMVWNKGNNTCEVRMNTQPGVEVTYR